MNCRNTFSNRVKKTYIIGEISIYSCFGKYISGKANGFTRDGGEGITIAWNTSGKVRSVTGGSSPLDFSYSALGQRQIKAYLTEGGKASDYYIHDAMGNIMAIYTLSDNYSRFQLKEQHIYGSGRLGIYNRNIEVYPSEEVIPLSFTRGLKRYELPNHLGNVNTVISDRKIQFKGGYMADIKSYVDYYPFGYQIPERTWSSTDYRFGFNGQEKDDEIYGEGKILSFEFRNYDNRLGRFWRIDPKYNNSPSWSPYSFANNAPIIMIDLFGEKGVIYIQVMFDKEGKPLVDKKTMNSIKEKIEAKGNEINVDWAVKVIYSNKIMSRKEFERRPNADNADSYVLIGTGKKLNTFVDKNREENLGWNNPSNWPSSVNGTSTDKLHYINIDNVSKINGENFWETPYASMEEKLYLTILHEDGHPKFEGHSKNFNEKAGWSSRIGHVGGTIMAPVPKEDKYDSEMIKMLQEIHGKKIEGNEKPTGGGHDSQGKNMY